MINQANITNTWIKEAAGERNADPLLVEKVIRAFLLLEGLVKLKVDFVFKGGTALMLHFHSTKRLSIDIDIILPDKEIELEEVLQSIVEQQGFTRFELQIRNAISDIEKAHYKLFYKPVRDSGKSEEYIMLDILLEDVHYNTLTELPIQSPFVPQNGTPLVVTIPSKEDLLGDKLTAFAPNTTGIPYFKKGESRSMEIIKQLFDIGTLFDEVEDLQVVKDTFNTFAKAELSYRGQSKENIESVLDDIFETSLVVCTRGMGGVGNFEELQSGIKSVKAYILLDKYNLIHAISHASKAAYLAIILKQNADNIERFDPEINMKDWIIKQPFNTRVNKLKISDPEAFFYWYKMYEMSKS